jgi:transposase
MWTARTAPVTTAASCDIRSDLTDDEWRLVEPLIPPNKTGGGKRTVIMREVVNGLMYILSTAVSGARSQKTSRRKARSTTTRSVDV